MLPVAHHAWTLATGALWSSCTMSVSPFGRTHFCAELGGKVITDESLIVAVVRLAVLNIIAGKSARRGANRLIPTFKLAILPPASQSWVSPGCTASINAL